MLGQDFITYDLYEEHIYIPPSFIWSFILMTSSYLQLCICTWYNWNRKPLALIYESRKFRNLSFEGLKLLIKIFNSIPQFVEMMDYSFHLWFHVVHYLDSQLYFGNALHISNLHSQAIVYFFYYWLRLLLSNTSSNRE